MSLIKQGVDLLPEHSQFVDYYEGLLIRGVTSIVRIGAAAASFALIRPGRIDPEAGKPKE